MKLFLSYLRLVRPLNLFIIAFTLYMVRFFFICAVIEYPKLYLPVSEIVYALFSLSFLFMAAGGYIINDYYDVEMDKINKPGKVIVGSIISARSALIGYWILNVSGLITGFLSCYLAGIPLLGFLFLFYLIALWFYSYKLKSTFLFGNLLIGLFLALVPLGGACIHLAVPFTQHTFEWQTIQNNQKPLVWGLMGGISIFAFLSAVIREIVKDAEDVEGDRLPGCRTMPVVIGTTKTKWVVFFLLVLLNIPLGYIQYQFNIAGVYPLLYFLVCIQFPFLILFYKLKKASLPKDFHTISTWLKIVMFAGIIYVFAISFYVYTISLFISSLFQ